MHGGRHRGEGEDGVHPESSGRVQEPGAEGVLAQGRLGLADENRSVAPAVRILPEEEPALRKPPHPHQAVLHVDVLDVEEVAHGDRVRLVHSKPRHRIP